MSWPVHDVAPDKRFLHFLEQELKNFTPKKVRLNLPPQSPFALMSSRASSSVVVVLL